MEFPPFAFFCASIFFLVISCKAQPTTDPSEVIALNSIFRQWGISASNSVAPWNISGEPCSGAVMNGTDFDSPPFNPAIQCDCTYNDNMTCHITRLISKLGFLATDGKALKPADILLPNWVQGKDACVDITGVSPFAGVGIEGFIPGKAVFQAGVRKKTKYEDKCSENGYSFIPFAFTTFGELGEEALEILSRIRQFAKGHTSCAKLANHIINRISFTIQKGVGAQLAARLPTSYM